MRSRRPSTVLEMFWSTEPTRISVLVGATQLRLREYRAGDKLRDIGAYQSFGNGIALAQSRDLMAGGSESLRERSPDGLARQPAIGSESAGQVRDGS